MNDKCKVCGKEDLYSAVSGEAVCSICKLKYIGGLPTTQDRINQARERLGLKDGEFLQQDNYGEARKILRRSR